MVVERIEAECGRDGASLEDALHPVEFGNDVTVAALVGYLGEHLPAPVHALELGENYASDGVEAGQDQNSQTGVGLVRPEKRVGRHGKGNQAHEFETVGAHAAPGRNGFSHIQQLHIGPC